MPAGEPVQERVEVPEPPAIDVEERLQERFVELVVTARETAPVKPLSEATEIVEVPATPTLAVTLVGVAVKPKSAATANMNVALVE